MTLVPAVVVVVVLEGGKTPEWAIPSHSWALTLEMSSRFYRRIPEKQHILSLEHLLGRRTPAPAAGVAGDTGSSGRGCAVVVAVERKCPASPCCLLRMESLRLRGVRDSQPWCKCIACNNPYKRTKCVDPNVYLSRCIAAV